MPITISGSGTITGLTTGGLPDGSIAAGDLASTLDLTGKTVTLPAGTGGKILQVVQTVKTDTYSATSSSTETDITGMSASITPSSTSSKILVQVTLNYVVGPSYGGHYIVLKRGSTNIFIGDTAGSRPRVTMAATYDLSTGTYGPATRTFSYLDSPATASSVTYKLAHGDADATGNQIYVNRAVDNTDAAAFPRSASNIILMEVAA